jgi:hypothetical protein
VGRRAGDGEKDTGFGGAEEVDKRVSFGAVEDADSLSSKDCAEVEAKDSGGGGGGGGDTFCEIN